VSEAHDRLIGTNLAARYRVDALLARGGMARVYRARDERLERDVAIKVLSSPYADDPAFTERFLGEARAAASLSHPSLVHVYDSGSDGDAHYIVMELLERHRTLRDVLDERGSLPRDEVLRIGRELLAGLRVVHEQDLVHCDVKAGNVMLGPGPAKLIDFGIATPPHPGDSGDTSIGSLQYMAPEQLHGEALTPASDLFSLGAVLYEALTGRVPYPGSDPAAVSAAHAAGSIRPPSTLVEGVPGRLDEAILQALRRDPQQRFRSAQAMSRALEAAADELTAARGDETRVIRRSDGYVPPSVPDAPVPAAAPAARPARAAPVVRRRAADPAGRRRGAAGRLGGLLGTLLILGAAALVIVLVVLPLLELGGGGDGTPSATPAATSAAPTVPAGQAPGVVGMATADAIALAREAGLNWRLECAQDPSKPEGIIDQEPPAGAALAPGGRFTMYSARISDCR
jgi:serine/threonine-protein kinase